MSQSNSQTYLDLANKYMELRISKKNDEILDLLDENVVVKSERDGIHTGKQAVKAYINRVPPTGKWEKAQLCEKGNKAYIPGVVNVMWIDWKVFALFSFTNPTDNQPIKINKIIIKRGTIDN